MAKMIYMNNYNFNDTNLICKYPNKIVNRLPIDKVLLIFKKKEFDSIFLDKKRFLICGRIFGKRVMGKSTFIDLRDFSGCVQLYFSSSFLGNYDFVICNLSLGDIISVSGKLFRTKTGEVSLNVLFLDLLSKNFRPFPDKHFGLLDKEVCYRQRYLDIMVNKSSMNKFIIRSKILCALRQFFLRRGFLEVETPAMQNIIGGADAKPFETYHNYLDSKLFLRVSPELYLKRLIVGGFEKIFEIGKSFRNEGLSTKHNPEFTMIEFYQAYSNYNDLIFLTQKLFRFLSKYVFNTTIFNYNDVSIDFSLDFTKICFFDALLKYTSFSLSEINDINFLSTFFTKEKIYFDQDFKLGDFHSKLFDIFVEKNLINPTFVLHYPISISPLSRRLDIDPELVERFELYICGKEIANGFSELNNPKDQSDRFLKQLKDKSDFKMCYDVDYIEALMYGLPPTAGEGIGIDRLVMLFTNSLSIKDVLFFPLMKQK
jgi:lysyl-tRNA synthetase class 2